MRMGLAFDVYDDAAFVAETVKKEENPDVKLNVTELIKKYGFPVETHTVYTDDNYVLTLHRIPFGRKHHPSHADSLSNNDNNVTSSGTQEAGEKKPIALLHHGLCSSSVDWIMNTADKALPYMLADAGYDVWMANARGNRYSKRNIAMTPKKSAFWDFSWHEIGKYDIPASIDYILATTGLKELNYVGHSMGTTAFFVAMSLRPEYNAKVRKMIALAPAVHLEGMKSPLRYMARFGVIEKFIYDLLGNGEILPDYVLKYMHQFAPSACTESDTFTTEICDNIMYAIGGYNPGQMNETQMPVILAHAPSTCSTKSAIHFLQSVHSGKFRQYDYGMIGNIQKYGQMNPPIYKLSKVTAPVSIFWSENDVLCDPKGVKRLKNELPNCETSIKINDTQFTHIDYLYAKDADKLVYKKVMDLLEQQGTESKEIKKIDQKD
ncbi:Lipase 3 [Folsomia candida]|uniref:Lipase n=2 Tax=Folsomia candida TaxID=158441 RepID=A0A226E6Y9_FOLCA|nr:Lipase 3 [Folsomia candida]